MAFLQSGLLILAVSAVAIADIFLKKTQDLGSFGKALTSPWMAGALVLYLFQIAVFTYLFTSGAKLSYVGVLQTTFYALIVLLFAVLFFNESLSVLQITGIFLALLGVVLMNL